MIRTHHNGRLQAFPPLTVPIGHSPAHDTATSTTATYTTLADPDQR